MSSIKKNIDSNSILSKSPYIYNTFKSSSQQNGVDLVVNKDDVCRLYVENWKKTGRDQIPNGFIPNKAVRDLLSDPTNSIVTDVTPYIKFMIDNIQINLQETVTPMKNFGHGFVTYAFGQEPPVFTFSGALMSTKFDNWSDLFVSLYHYFLRATKLAELSLLNNVKYQVVMQYQGKILKGSLIGLTEVRTADLDTATRFSFQFLVKSISFEWDGLSSTSNISLNAANLNRKKVSGTGIPLVLNTTTQVSDNTINEIGLSPVFNSVG